MLSDCIFGCRNSVDCTFRIRNHTYIQHQLCVKPEQPFIIRNLYVSDQYAAYSRTVLDHQKNKTRQDTIEILLQLPFSFIFSAFIDFNMALTSNLHPDNYGISIALLLTGCMIQSIGVVLELKPKVAMMSAEAFVKYASRRYNKEFGKFKVCFDVTLVTLAVILSLLLSQCIEGVREGSLIAACITGYIVSFLNQKIMTRKTLYKLLPVLK